MAATISTINTIKAADLNFQNYLCEKFQKAAYKRNMERITVNFQGSMFLLSCSEEERSEIFAEENREITRICTGMRPSEYKELMKTLGYKFADNTSGIQLMRKHAPAQAAMICLFHDMRCAGVSLQELNDDYIINETRAYFTEKFAEKARAETDGKALKKSAPKKTKTTEAN